MATPSDRRRLHTLDRTTQLLRGRANRHAWMGLGIAIGAIVAATLLACRYEHGDYALHNLLATQQNNPALWLLDLTSSNAVPYQGDRSACPTAMA